MIFEIRKMSYFGFAPKAEIAKFDLHTPNRPSSFKEC